MTLAVIDSYLTLKRGEVWMELAEELREDGIVPVDEDAEVLRLACQVCTCVSWSCVILLWKCTRGLTHTHTHSLSLCLCLSLSVSLCL